MFDQPRLVEQLIMSLRSICKHYSAIFLGLVSSLLLDPTAALSGAKLLADEPVIQESLSDQLTVDEPLQITLSDEAAIDSGSQDAMPQVASSHWRSNRQPRRSSAYDKSRTPAMIGDFYAGNPLSLGANITLDRLFVFANDLDAPLMLPGAGQTLSISEPGPVGIFASSLTDIQQIQTLLRASAPLPGATLVGTVSDDAVLNSSLTIAQIQSLLASTGSGYDIVSLAAPPATYNSAVEAVFLARNAQSGASVYNEASSGAVLQGGTDTLNGGEDLDAFYFYDYVIRFNTTLADATSGGVGRMKVAEGGTILPQNRIFFRYNYLSGVGYSNSRANLNRLVPGFERALLDGLMSFELRAPFATDATTTATFDGNSITNGEHTRFGNLSLYLKALLMQRESLAISGGLGIGLPSAEDITVDYANGSPLLRVSNQTVRLQPFLGALYTPGERLFLQSFVQVDTAANSNSVSINSTGTGLTRVGKLTDSSNLYTDVGLGYWLYRSQASQGLTGIIPMLEIHHNVALQDSDLLAAGPFQVTNSQGTNSMTNFVAGNTFEFGQQTRLTAAYTAPISGGSDRQYNGGLQMFLSRGW